VNHLDLCSGIGGFALAAAWTGHDTIGFCEIDPFCRRVLAKNFPGVPQHDDLKTLTAGTVRGWIGDRHPRHVAHTNDADEQARRADGVGAGEPTGTSARSRQLDLITGGYPCQPFSLAGKRLGTEDDRHLWPYIAALVADLQPRRCLFENVYGHVSMGLDAVLSDLEALGYACGAVVVPACAVGAPHRRDRVWILADAHEQRIDGSGAHRAGRAEPANGRGNVPDAHGARRTGYGSAIGTPAEHTTSGRHIGSERGEGLEALSGMGDTVDGLSRWLVGPSRRDPWAGDWEAGCPRVTEREADRTHKLKALGNSIVPQVAYEILRCWS
jgi:DNA (cytosine-5)-methyltransferase 1